MRFVKTACMALLAMCSLAAIAQEIPPPPAELKKLDWMVGEWSGKVKWTMAGVPESEETMDFKVDWDGNFLRSTSKMTMMGMSVTESVYIGWDAKSNKYLCHTFTNLSNDPRIERGTLDGKTFTTVSDPWSVMGSEAVGRATQRLNDDGSIYFLLEMKEGDKWTKMSEGTFKKKTATR